MTPEMLQDLINQVVELRISPAEFFKKCYDNCSNNVIEKYDTRITSYMVKDLNLINVMFRIASHVFPNIFMAQFEAKLEKRMCHLYFLGNPLWIILALGLPHRTPTYLNDLSTATINFLIKHIDKLFTSSDTTTCDIRNICLKYAIDAVAYSTCKLKTGCLEGSPTYYKEILKLIMELALIRRIKFSSFYFNEHYKSENSNDSSINDIKKATLDAVRKSGSLVVDGHDMTDLLTKMENGPVEDLHFKYAFNEYTTTSIAMEVYSNGIGSPILNTLPMALFELALQPNIQSRLRDEIIATLKKFKGYIYSESVNDMPYLHAVILEVYRKYPYITFMDRRCMKDGNTIQDPFTTIKKGEMIFTSVYALQNDKKNLLGGNTFNPGRFLKNSLLEPIYKLFGYGCGIHPKGNMPFGHGPHSLIARLNAFLQMKIALIHILRKYVVLPCAETPKEIQFDPLHMELTPLGKLPLTFKRNILPYSPEVDKASSTKPRTSSKTENTKKGSST